MKCPLIESAVRLFSNPVLTLWVSYQQVWDRIDSLDHTEAFVDRLCAFINPEGMKAVMDKRDMDLETTKPDHAGPKPKIELPKEMLERFEKIPEFAAKRHLLIPEEPGLDEIVLGGDDA